MSEKPNSEDSAALQRAATWFIKTPEPTPMAVTPPAAQESQP